jgi:hypothetical protein
MEKSTMTGFQQSFPRIAIASIEGTARSVRHRQQQFIVLFNSLLRLKLDLVDAIKNDFNFSDAEALFEYSLTLKEIKTHYENLNMGIENAKRRSFETGEDNKDHTVPFKAAVYIASQRSLFSTLAPLAAAMAAGNCIILEVSKILGCVGPLNQH